ncbi:MAG: endolytic transglycosylase MltG [Minisyncoccia bacterium]
MKKDSSFLIIFILTFSLFFLFFVFINWPLKIQGKEFTIYSQENLQEIAGRLKKEKIIPSASLFVILVRLYQKEKSLQPGVYYFSSQISLKKLISILTNKNFNNSMFLIKEGETLNEIEEKMKEKGMLQGELTNYRLGDFFEEGQCLKEYFFDHQDASLEGFLFPDTYHFPPGLNEKELLKIILDNFCQKFFDNQIKEKIISFQHNFQEYNLKNEPSFYDILIMASLLEKEVKTEEEKRMVADILWRRLSKEMPLQIDATVCYAHFKKFQDCFLTQKDLKIDSLYNTYIFTGLPPTPISNPGIESIKSVVSPLKNNFWFYLTAKDGKAIFSESYEEHLNNRNKYLK